MVQKHSDLSSSQEVPPDVLVEVLVEIQHDFRKRSRTVPGSPMRTSSLRTPSPLVAVRESSPSSAGNCGGRFCGLKKLLKSANIGGFLSGNKLSWVLLLLITSRGTSLLLDMFPSQACLRLNFASSFPSLSHHF